MIGPSLTLAPWVGAHQQAHLAHLTSPEGHVKYIPVPRAARVDTHNCRYSYSTPYSCIHPSELLRLRQRQSDSPTACEGGDGRSSMESQARLPWTGKSGPSPRVVEAQRQLRRWAGLGWVWKYPAELGLP